MSKVIRYMPELEGDEQVTVARLMKGMTEEQAEQYAHVYRQRRKDATVVLLTALVGFLGAAGIHRFYLGQVWMGLLFFFTAGFCGIGTIVDIVRHKQLTHRFNEREARDAARLIRGAFPEPRRSTPQMPPSEDHYSDPRSLRERNAPDADAPDTGSPDADTPSDDPDAPRV